MRALLVLLALFALAPPARADVDWTPHPGAALPPEAVFRDDAGRTVVLGDLMADRPLVLALGYYHCNLLCGVVRDDLLSALERAGLRPGRDYTLAILSIDLTDRPADAAAAKRQAMNRHGGDGAGWNFLVGNSEAVQRAVGFHARYDQELQQFVHPAGAVVAAPAGRVSAYLLGVGFAPEAMRAAVLQARAGAVAPPPSPVLLLCLHYDPATGRYSVAIERVLAIAAALTASALGLYLLLAHRRGRA